MTMIIFALLALVAVLVSVATAQVFPPGVCYAL